MRRGGGEGVGREAPEPPPRRAPACSRGCLCLPAAAPGLAVAAEGGKPPLTLLSSPSGREDPAAALQGGAGVHGGRLARQPRRRHLRRQPFAGAQRGGPGRQRRAPLERAAAHRPRREAAEAARRRGEG